ncbi:hypothetical protein [Dysgonomonas reticulitermitis]
MEDFIIPITIILVTVLTIFVIVGIWFFGRFIFNQRVIECKSKERIEEYLHDLIYDFKNHDNRYYFLKVLTLFTNLSNDFSEKRNDFWTTYGQIIICVFIVCIIALLLLTKVISAEAGLPILSAISGFAIAKGSTIRNQNNDNLNNNNG